MPASRGPLRRAFEAPGLPIWQVGVGVALFGCLLFALQELALGRIGRALSDPVLLDNVRVALTHVVITAYLLTAYVVAQQTTDQAIARVRPDAASAGYDSGERTALAVSLLIGALWFGFVNTRISPGEVSLLPTSWTPETAWHRVLGFVMALLTARIFVLLVVEANRLSAAAEAIGELDLLSTERVIPFVRQGLTYALLVIGLASVFALFLVDLRYLPLFGLILVGTVLVGLAALLLPLRGIRAQIIAAKAQELRWCHEQMRERRARLANGERADAAGLDELVAWEARIQGVREWPLDTSTFTRFLIYLLIPLGSWAGGALVERAIDALLD